MFGNAQAHRAVRDTMDDSTVNGMRKGVGLRPTTVLGMGLAIAILIAMPVAFADGTRTTYSGRAFGASVHVGLLDAKFADTGNLPAEGGEIDATTVTVHTDPAQAEVLLSITMGFDEKAESEAATAAVTLLPGSTNEITAAFVRAQSVATCSGASGESELVELRLGGQPIVVSSAPNQVIGVAGVFTLVINEQIDSSHDRTAAITVNALHLTLVTGDEVIVSSAHSDITCGQGAPTPKDFVTGGGFIETPDGKANFGLVAGVKPGQQSLRESQVQEDGLPEHGGPQPPGRQRVLDPGRLRAQYLPMEEPQFLHLPQFQREDPIADSTEGPVDLLEAHGPLRVDQGEDVHGPLAEDCFRDPQVEIHISPRVLRRPN